MNFSNFFIDMLNGNEPAASSGSRKNLSTAFLFSDIMKVCEEENLNALGQASTAISIENPKEIFSASDSVINIQPQEFEVISQLVQLIVKESGDLQSACTTHQIEEAKITKQQFLVTESKLVNLLSDLIEKGNYPFGPFIHQLQSSESNKAISLSFKSGTDKITISFNPIKVDEKYTNTILNDEYGFVNKLIVREGLLNAAAEELTSDLTATVTENDTKQDKADGAEEEVRLAETANQGIPGQLFFRTEIIKIISENSSTTAMPVDGETSFSSFVSYKNFVKENKSKNDPASAFSKIENLNTEPKFTVNSEEANRVANNTGTEDLTSETKPVVNPDEVKLMSKNNYAAPEQIKIINASKNDVNTNQTGDSCKSISVASLLEGLSDAEKSVFKNFATSGELKEITYTKESTASLNTADISGKLQSTDEITQEKEFSNISLKAALNISAKEKTESIENRKKGYTGIQEINIPGKEESSQILNNSSSENNSEAVNAKNPDTKPAIESAKIFVKMNAKSAAILDVKAEVIDSNISGETAPNTELNKSTKAETTVSIENPGVKQNENILVKEKNLESPSIPIEVTEKNKISVKSDPAIEKSESNHHQEALANLNAKEEKTSNNKDGVESKENISEEVKNVKQTTKDSKADLSTNDDSSKRDAHESFKNTFTQALSSDFEVEKTKAFSDLKTFQEPAKIIKQNEIIPEFSKLIQQGEKQSMTFQITPENLGKVKLTVDLVNNQIQTNIEVESEQIKQFIQSNVEQLKQNLQASGITMNNVNISLADYNQKNANKMFAPKKRSGLRNEKEIPIEEISDQPLKKMGYNTYEFLA